MRYLFAAVIAVFVVTVDFESSDDQISMDGTIFRRRRSAIGTRRHIEFAHWNCDRVR